MRDLYYPDVECSEVPLREGSAPIDGCSCFVCGWLRHSAVRLIPRVIRRDPFVGILERNDLSPATAAATIASID